MRTRTRIQAIATTLVLGVSLITFTIRACSSIHVATDPLLGLRGALQLARN